MNDEVKGSTKVANMIEQQPYDREQAISNYRKLFTRGSSLTKEILGRVQHVEVAKGRRKIFGYEFQLRHFCREYFLFCRTVLLPGVIFLCMEASCLVNSSWYLQTSAPPWKNF